MLNFGESNFTFDLDQKLKQYYFEIHSKISTEESPSLEAIKILVKDYLVHEGYFSTIQALEKQDGKEIRIKDS